ncbi:MAG: TlyA family RNA methyltransferase [Candidatus Saccharimonadales bacterium]
MKKRLDVLLAEKKLVASRSQAESYIRLGKVKVDGTAATKPGQLVNIEARVTIAAGEQYVSRAALKLQSADEVFSIDWQNKTVLDVGSSTGGFTEYALKHGASKVFAVDVGTNQLHPTLRQDPRISLHEKTDIRKFVTKEHIDIVVGDVSFISLRDILPHVATIISPDTKVIAMVKPQFEAGASNVKHKGVIKNDRMRRDILKDFEQWSKQRFIIRDKTDSKVAGSKGNVERFYLMSLV